MIVGLLVVISILTGLVSLARLSDAQSRLSAVAQDSARLFAGLEYQRGQITESQIVDQAKNDLGHLGSGSSLNLVTNANLVIVTLRTQIPILFNLGSSALAVSVEGRAAIYKES